MSLASNLNYALSSAKQMFGLSSYPIVTVTSSVDGQTYRVRDMSDKQEAADMMARIRVKMNKLKVHLEGAFPDKPQVKQLARNFEANPNRFYEATPDADHTSYSVNKGEAVHFCLREREGGNESLVKEDIVVFVAIHEMGHMITETIGHGPDFWNNFAWLLKEAEAMKVYEFTNFAAHPVEYCGIHITDQPTYKKERDVDAEK